MTSDIRSLPLTALVLSQTPIQVERRAQFNQAALKELATTIKVVGRVEQAITVRPIGDGGKFEIADGERRYLGTKIAGLGEILAEIRDLDDEQVETIQIVTGLQKEGLHELVEAEGYETLLKRGQSVDEIALKCGKSKGTVYARMKLLALCPDARTAFRNGKVSASVALLLARIPVPELQQQALEHILKPSTWNDEPLTYRATLEYIHKEFTLRLSEAPFPRDDADLVSVAGTCGACPKRTGNQPELFGDIKGADVCTDPACFKTKCTAFSKLQVAKAKDTGQPIITGAEAKKITPPSWSKELRNGYVRPTDKCEDDPKRRTYAQLIGKAEVASALLQNPDTRKFSKVYKKEDLKEALATKGVKLAKEPERDDSSSHQTRYKAQEAKRAKDEKHQQEVLRRILKAHNGVLSREDLGLIGSALFETGYGSDFNIFAILGLKKSTGSFESQVEKLSGPDLNRLLLGLSLESAIDTYSAPKTLWATAKRFKIDPNTVREELEQEEQPAPAKASKKKARK